MVKLVLHDRGLRSCPYLVDLAPVRVECAHTDSAGPSYSTPKAWHRQTALVHRDGLVFRKYVMTLYQWHGTRIDQHAQRNLGKSRITGVVVHFDNAHLLGHPYLRRGQASAICGPHGVDQISDQLAKRRRAQLSNRHSIRSVTQSRVSEFEDVSRRHSVSIGLTRRF